MGNYYYYYYCDNSNAKRYSVYIVYISHSSGDVMTKFYFSILLTIFGLGSYPTVNAGEIEDLATIDFSLRLPSALTKFSSAGDVAGFGGASSAS